MKKRVLTVFASLFIIAAGGPAMESPVLNQLRSLKGAALP